MVISLRSAAAALLGVLLAFVFSTSSFAVETAAPGASAGPVITDAKKAIPASAEGQPAGKSVAKTGPRKGARKAAKAPFVPTKAASVYLFRGFMGIFSLGMDQLDAKLKARGVKTRLLMHFAWPTVVDEIVAEAKSQPRGRYPLVLIGHSLGGNAVLALSAELARRGVPTTLVVTVDPTQAGPITPSVGRYLNIYVKHGLLGAELAGKSKVIDNDNIREDPALKGSGANHFTLDKNPVIQQQIMTAVLAALGYRGKN